MMKKMLAKISCLTLGLFLHRSVAFAAESVAAPKIDTGDTAFILISAALVLLMTPALALFYGGMCRTKNVLSTIMQSFFVIGLISVQWVLFGYSLAFGPDLHHFIGSLEWLGLSGVFIALVGLAANIYFQHRRDKREAAESMARIAALREQCETP